MPGEVLIPMGDLVKWLTQLEDDHLDHGRRLQAKGVRSAIQALQRNVQTNARRADGTSARAMPRSDPGARRGVS